MSSCPDCGSNFTRRIPRGPLMRMLVGSKRILCTNCGERSLVFPWSRARAGEKTVSRMSGRSGLGY